MAIGDRPQGKSTGIRGERGLATEHKNHCNSHSLIRNAASCSACGNFCNYSADPKQLPSAKCGSGKSWDKEAYVVCGANGEMGHAANAHLNISFCDGRASAA